MSVMEFITLFSGIAMFLFGMNIMGDGLQKAAGDRFHSIIDKFTGNVFKGVFLGAAVTALVQSSSATTVMLVGFVNAGLMTLKQAVGVIMGANIGTTVTAWIVSLSELSTGSSAWMVILKPKTFAPIIFVAGVVISMFFVKKNTKRLSAVADICIGFGLLFIGMTSMEASVATLQEMPLMQKAFTTFSNPVIGVIVGAVVTAIIQSSSASVGILQAAAATGLVTFSSAIPIIMGQNIGTCITAILSSIGTSKNAKKASAIHLMFNLIGTVVFMVLVYALKALIVIPFWDNSVGMADIATIHTLFNIANTCLLLPFSNLLVKLADFVIRGDDSTKVAKHLDERFLNSPSVALSLTLKEVAAMGDYARKNVMLTSELLTKNDSDIYSKIEETENVVDSLEFEITEYLSQVLTCELTDEQNSMATGLFHVVNDIERISDHAINVADIINDNKKKNITFSDVALEEIAKIYEVLDKILETTVDSYSMDDINDALKVEPLEEVIDELIEKLRMRHMERLNQRECNVHAGIQFLDLMTNFERISDHCSNIGMYVVGQHARINPHVYAKQMHNSTDENYRAYFEKYLNKYDV